jgi:hypothetical protein
MKGSGLKGLHVSLKDLDSLFYAMFTSQNKRVVAREAMGGQNLLDFEFVLQILRKGWKGGLPVCTLLDN